MKFYISSGKFKIVIDRDGPEKAVFDSFKRLRSGDSKASFLDQQIKISLRGFKKHEGDIFIKTQPVLTAVGLTPAIEGEIDYGHDEGNSAG